MDLKLFSSITVQYTRKYLFELWRNKVSYLALRVRDKRILWRKKEIKQTKPNLKKKSSINLYHKMATGAIFKKHYRFFNFLTTIKYNKCQSKEEYNNNNHELKILNYYWSNLTCFFNFKCFIQMETYHLRRRMNFVRALMLITLLITNWY